MPLPSLLQKFGRDLLYLSILGCLMGWICVDRARNEIWNEILSSDFKKLGEISEHQSYMLENEIYMLANYYKTDRNDRYMARMENVKRQVDSFKVKVRNLHASIVSSTSFYSPPFSAVDLKNLECATQILRDSLIQYIDKDIPTTHKINNDLELDSSAQFWKKAQIVTKAQAITFLIDLETKSEIAYSTVLKYCYKRLDNYCGGIADNIVLMLPEKPVVRPNEPLNAEIFLASKHTDSKNLTIKINGESLPIFGGFARFSQRYSDAGLKKFLVQIEAKNPFTGELTNYVNTYQLMVQDSCR